MPVPAVWNSARNAGTELGFHAPGWVLPLLDSLKQKTHHLFIIHLLDLLKVNRIPDSCWACIRIRNQGSGNICCSHGLLIESTSAKGRTAWDSRACQAGGHPWSSQDGKAPSPVLRTHCWILALAVQQRCPSKLRMLHPPWACEGEGCVVFIFEHGSAWSQSDTQLNSWLSLFLAARH